MAETLTTFEGGATCSAQAGRYDLIPAAAYDYMARRFALGVESHGESNWRNGAAKFAKANLSHIVKHLADYIEHGRREDLEAFLCRGAMAADFHERGFVPGGVQVDMCDSVGLLADGRAGYMCHEDKGHDGPHRCGGYEWSDLTPTMRHNSERILEELALNAILPASERIRITEVA